MSFLSISDVIGMTVVPPIIIIAHNYIVSYGFPAPEYHNPRKECVHVDIHDVAKGRPT